MPKQQTETTAFKKRKLNRYRDNIERIKHLEQRLQHIEDKITSIRSPQYSDMPKGTQTITTADLITEKVDIEYRLQHLRSVSDKLKQKVYELIDQAETGKYSEALELRYIKGLTDIEIARSLRTTERNALHILNQAIKSISIL